MGRPGTLVEEHGQVSRQPGDMAVVVGVKEDQPELLDVAVGLAGLWDAPLRVVHAFELLVVAAEICSSEIDDDGPRRRPQRVIDDARSRLDEAGTPDTAYVLDDGAPIEVLERAGADARVLVLGADDVGRLGRMMGGEVALHVALHAPAPVVLVPPGWTAGPLRDIVLAVDEANVADGPLAFAFEIARLAGARLRVMHVVRSVDQPVDLTHQGGRLVQLVERWSERFDDVEAFPSLLSGDAADAGLIASATAQMVIVGRPDEPMRGQLLGVHVAAEIARRARCPVAVVPEAYTSAPRRSDEPAD